MRPEVNVLVGGPKVPTNYTYKTVVLKSNLPFADQVQEPNCIYVIKWDFDLKSETATIPENCVLKFEGGSLSNATLVGQSTAVDASISKIFGDGLFFDGIWNISTGYAEWFGAVGDGITDDTDAINKCVNLFDKRGGIIQLCEKSYLINSIVLKDNVTLQGVPSKNNYEYEKGTKFCCVSRDLPAIQCATGVTVQDINFFYPEQEINYAPKNNLYDYTEYPPSIEVTPTIDGEPLRTGNVTINRVSFTNAFIGISAASTHENLIVDSVVGYCMKYGIYDYDSHDVDRIRNTHFNFNYLGGKEWNEQPGEITSKRNMYIWYTRDNGTAFHIIGCDWFVMSNCFAYGYNIGIKVGDVDLRRSLTGSIMFCGFDGCQRGIEMVKSRQILISGCMFTSFDYTKDYNTLENFAPPLHDSVIKIHEDCWGIDIQNCTFYEVDANGIESHGDNITINGCMFYSGNYFSGNNNYFIKIYSIFTPSVGGNEAVLQRNNVIISNNVFKNKRAGHIIRYISLCDAPIVNITNNVFEDDYSRDICPINVLYSDDYTYYVTHTGGVEIAKIYAEYANNIFNGTAALQEIIGPSSDRPNLRPVSRGFFNNIENTKGTQYFDETYQNKAIHLTTDGWLDAYGYGVGLRYGLSSSRPRQIDDPNEGTSAKVLKYPRDLGYSYFDIDLGKYIYAAAINNELHTVRWIEEDGATAGVARMGEFANTPSGSDIYIGFVYMRTDGEEGSKYPIYYGGDDKWYKADGSEVTE